MNKAEISEILKKITLEEEEILGGQNTIDRSIYMQDDGNPSYKHTRYDPRTRA